MQVTMTTRFVRRITEPEKTESKCDRWRAKYYITKWCAQIRKDSDYFTPACIPWTELQPQKTLNSKVTSMPLALRPSRLPSKHKLYFVRYTKKEKKKRKPSSRLWCYSTWASFHQNTFRYASPHLSAYYRCACLCYSYLRRRHALWPHSEQYKDYHAHDTSSY